MPSDAEAWVNEHGGPAACASDVLALTDGQDSPGEITRALSRMGAPPEVFALVWQDIWKQTRSSGSK